MTGGTNDLNASVPEHRVSKRVIDYEIMHGANLVAEINTSGEVVLWNERFCPYNLYLEQERDFDVQINNLNNFYYWCASRVLPLDRKYAKGWKYR